MSTNEPGWKTVTDLTGKTAVLTGCASGIGRATAIQLAGAGARVIGGDVNVEDGERTAADIRARGERAEFEPLDLADRASIDRFAQGVLARAGAPDIIVNAAGWERVGPFVENTPDFWDRLVAINYVGPVRLIQKLLPAMMERRGGKIVTVASDAGRVGSLGETFYAGTKGAVIAFTKSLARETARYNIHCNCVCPGPTDTPLFHSIPSDKIRDALVKAVPFKRLAKPVEIANTIVFFASPASDFISGQVLSVSGGLTMVG